MSEPADIDRLIEEGLNRYGAGDLDGALLSWEQALAIDPENPQANSYVDYVRDNYDVLGVDQTPGVTDAGETGVPFGIEDEPEYMIEIVPGELASSAPPPMYMDPLDEGWFIAEEETHGVRLVDRFGPAQPREHAGPSSARIRGAAVQPEAGISFDDATTEYQNSRAHQPPLGAPEFHQRWPRVDRDDARSRIVARRPTSVSAATSGSSKPTRAPTPTAGSPRSRCARHRRRSQTRRIASPRASRRRRRWMTHRCRRRRI